MMNFRYVMPDHIVDVSGLDALSYIRVECEIAVAAIISAIEDALARFGARLSAMPITPEQIVAIVADAEPDARVA